MSRRDLIAALHDLEVALRDLETATRDSGAGVPGGAGLGALAAPQPPAPGEVGVGDAGGAVAGVQRAGRFTQGLAAATAGLATAQITGGLTSLSRGGDFDVGFRDALTRAVARIPGFGEISGAAAEVRVQDAVASGVGSQIAEVRARGGQVSRGFEDMLTREGLEIEKRRELSRQRSGEVVKEMVDQGALGGLGSDIPSGRVFHRSPNPFGPNVAPRGPFKHSQGVEQFR